MSILKIIIIGLVLIVVLAIGVVTYVSYDMGQRATVSETLSPNGTMVGNALVVYDPSITDNTKNVAAIIASDLQARGYKVDLAGINSTAAENPVGYQVIVIGGPIYGGTSSTAVKSYLETLQTLEGTIVGVFATGTTNDPQQIAPLPINSTLQIKALMTVSTSDDKTQKCREFVDKLLQ